MTKTLIDLDDDLLAEASTALGTETKKDTVTKALEYAVEVTRERRRQALQRLRQITDEGGFNFDLLPELDK